MSESKAVQNASRTRRRAMRSAGPPADNPTEVTIVERNAAPTTADAVEEPDAAVATDAVESAAATVKLDVPVESGESASESAGPGEQPESARKLGWLGWTAATIAVLSALLLLGSGGFYVYHERHAQELDARRADYVQTAKQAVLNLTTIKDDTAQQDIDRVLAVASGQLKEEYASRKDAYAQVVQQAKVRASGEIIEAGLESEDDYSAQVLVAAKQTLTNAAAADPQQRYYRFRITVTHGDDGKLTASRVEFVP
ncbi:hypothetical protein [Nocardia transvalensis]|uniref:hypothetical protein n=1 Tax=Nocardia transvalensis TaxID=37333 RepID=UPI001894ECA1|nr:hypothetical protein [Nocardia transvalensis]MBF6332663.1 hypothetical protein [Nocardia transvalensis]